MITRVQAEQEVAAAESHTEQVPLIAAMLTKALEGTSDATIVVGGSAIEIYTSSRFVSEDMDLVASRWEAIKILESWGFQEHVRFPIPGKVIGETVTELDVEESHGLEVIAICERNGRKYRVRLQDIGLAKRVAGSRWIDAYRQFRGRDGLPPTGLIR